MYIISAVLQIICKTKPLKMFKFTDASTMVNKKITRNNIMLEVFNLCRNITEKDIELKQKVINFYIEQEKTIKKVNEIEQCQTQEYTIERQLLIQTMMKNIGDTSLIDPTDIIDEINVLKNKIKEKTSLMKQVQNLIPNEGVATNYTVRTIDENTTCANAARNY
jgi:hypothetical protein